MKIVVRILLLIAIVALAWMCVKSILTPMHFDKQVEMRKEAIVKRLIDIRTAEIGYKNKYGVYAANFKDLENFLNTEKLPFIVKEGELTDDQLKEGLTEREAVKKGLIKRDTTWILAKDTLLSPNYDVASLGKVPGFDNASFKLDTATLSSKSGYTVPVFECSIPFDAYLGDLDHQLLVNLKDKTTKLKRYCGLRVGSITEINNNAGNWE